MNEYRSYFSHRYWLAGLLVLFLPLLVMTQATWRLADIQYGAPYESSPDGPYGWEVVVKRADAWGGELNLIVTPRSAPACRRNYWISWTFDREVRTIRQGEIIGVSMFSRPTVHSRNCDWDYSRYSPARLMLLAGHASPLISDIVRGDPSQANWPYVCLVPYPEPAVLGDAPAANQQELQVHSGSGTIQVGGRLEEERRLAADARGGAFAFRIGDHGVHFEVVYQFARSNTTSALQPGSASVQVDLVAPVVRETRRSEDGMHWMGIKTSGVIRNARGKHIQVRIHFLDDAGQPLAGYAGEERYVDEEGFAAVSSEILTAGQFSFTLEDLDIWMPYYALNLGYSGGRNTYQLFMYAEVLVNGKPAGTSPYAAVRVDW